MLLTFFTHLLDQATAFLNSPWCTPLIGSLLYGAVAGATGILAIHLHQPLVGEVIAHTAYPGALLGALVTLAFSVCSASLLPFGVWIGGVTAAAIGLFLLILLERQKNSLSHDALLTGMIAASFGLAIILSSLLQKIGQGGSAQVTALFYGQPTTLSSFQFQGIMLLAGLCAAWFVWRFQEIQVHLFDPTFFQMATTKSRRSLWLKSEIYLLLLLVTVIGMRVVGVLMVTGMMILPYLIARPWIKSFVQALLYSVLVGVVMAILGNLVALLPIQSSDTTLFTPPGPVTLLVGGILLLFSLGSAKLKRTLLKQRL